jgi:hypothetical protein
VQEYFDKVSKVIVVRMLGGLPLDDQAFRHVIGKKQPDEGS